MTPTLLPRWGFLFVMEEVSLQKQVDDLNDDVIYLRLALTDLFLIVMNSETLSEEDAEKLNKIYQKYL